MTSAKTKAACSPVPLDPLVMPGTAVALRPVRFMQGDDLRYYTATTFPRNPRAGCDLYYRRCKAFGGVNGGSEQIGICDVLDAHGDVVADFPLTRHGLGYLYRALGCVVDGHNCYLLDNCPNERRMDRILDNCPVNSKNA